MSVWKSLAIAGILSLVALPAMAQQVISEPGYCAFFYPNANCQNKGPGNPYTVGNYYQRGYPADGMAPAGQTVGVAPSRSRAPKHAARPQ